MTTATGTGQGARFGLVLTRTSDEGPLTPFYRDLLAGLEEGLDRHGATVLMLAAADRADELAVYDRWADAGLVDAVLVTDLLADDPRAAHCRDRGLPVVLLGGDPGDGMPVVDDYDNQRAMRTAVEFLTGLGHRHIGRVSGPAGYLHTRARTAGFVAALADAGATGVQTPGDYSAGSGAEATRELLTAADRPTAVIYDNDVMAVAGLAVAGALGLRVPQDVSLLAWDDSAPCRLSHPALSVVSRDVHDLGEATAGVLLDVAAGRPTGPVRSPAVRVVPRGSTGPAPTAG